MDIQNAVVVDPEIPKSVDKACENLTDKPTKEIGNTLGDLWFLVFGGISERAEKKRLSIAKNIKDFKNELYESAKAIPEKQRQEPKLQIAGPALQKSQYCVEEKELREMFVKLISRSMDMKYDLKIRPSFSEIIAQMSPLDAQNLKLFALENLPIVEYKALFVKRGYQVLATNVFLANPKAQDIKIQASSISELSRLGLISLSYSEYILDERPYAVFFQNPFYIKNKQLVSPIPEGGYQSPRDDRLVKSIDVQRGVAELTPLGKDFLDVCIFA